MTATHPAVEATALDLAAVQIRRNVYVCRHMHPGAFACCSAHASADDVPALLGAVDTLASALAALLRLDESPPTGTEYAEAVERAHAALATVTPTTGGAA